MEDDHDEFHCPDCGSSWFRTYADPRDGDREGECKQFGFRWNRADDARYFYPAAPVLRDRLECAQALLLATRGSLRPGALLDAVDVFLTEDDEVRATVIEAVDSPVEEPLTPAVQAAIDRWHAALPARQAIVNRFFPEATDDDADEDAPAPDRVIHWARVIGTPACGRVEGKWGVTEYRDVVTCSDCLEMIDAAGARLPDFKRPE
jgi:hypothetical protein